MGRKSELNPPQNKNLDYDFVQDWARSWKKLEAAD